MTEAAAMTIGASPEHLDSGRRELIVDLKHWRAIIQTLHERNMGIEARLADTSEALGLARLLLDGELTSEFLSPPAGLPAGARWNPEDPVGVVLAVLQNAFSERWGGWIPTMGRNRLVGSVDGTDGVIVLANNDPEWSDDQLVEVEVAADDEMRARRAVRVGVVDTALRPHPFFEGKLITPYPRPYPPNPQTPFRAGHSMFVSGLILQRAPLATVHVDDVLDEEARSDSWEAAKAIVRVAGSGADIVNLSFACYTSDARAPLVLSTALSRVPAETMVIAAAGNYGKVDEPIATLTGGSIRLDKAPAWPAALDGVIAVGAVKKDGQRAAFSPLAPWVDVATLGEKVLSVLSAFQNGGLRTGQARWSGTSFAAARITGEIAARVRPGAVSPIDAWRDLQQSLTGGDPATGEPPVWS